MQTSLRKASPLLMRSRRISGSAFCTAFLFAILGSILAVQPTKATPSKVSINPDMVLVIDGKPVFPIGFTLPPPPDGKTPEGTDAIAELADAGATFMRTGAQATNWDQPTIEREQKYLDAAAKSGLHCMPFLREHSMVKTPEDEATLRQLIARFKDHPGLGAWKGDDEPEWGKKPIEPLARAKQVIKEVDPNHPVVIIQAPRGTVESLRPYNAAADVIGLDIYPISYPPGKHSTLTNKEISLVGDHTKIMMDVADGKLPVWMVLQISWSGVVKQRQTLRFPTFPEERFMTYEAIICGARGLIYFGGSNERAMIEEDRKLGWNWRFWKRVLRPVIEEIGTHSPLYPALLAPDSKLPIKVVSGKGIELRAREVGQTLFILTCKREGPTEKVEFSGLPASAREGELLYEEPRTVEAKSGKFADWFAPFEVHVYRFNL